jgi:hypothetical protein
MSVPREAKLARTKTIPNKGADGQSHDTQSCNFLPTHKLEHSPTQTVGNMDVGKTG